MAEIDAIIGNQSDSDSEADLSGLTLEDILREEAEDYDPDQASPPSPSTMNEEQLVSAFLDHLQMTIPQPSSSSSSSSQSKSDLSSPPVSSDTSKTPLTFHIKSPLELAEARESQILKAPSGDLISPLQVKRRLRSKEHQKDDSCTTGSEQSSSSIISRKKKAGKKFGSPNIVKIDTMEAISRQLKNNLQYQSNGPGSPTTVSIHAKFIAIGTSNGLIIVFDHFQNVRQVLGNAYDLENNDGPVTSIDVSMGGDFLVCGFQSGRIVLWDMLKGTSLKAVSDAHTSAVVSLKFYKDQKPCIVSVDKKGIVNKLNFSKIMGYMYVVDVDGILDGGAGAIPAISVLPQAYGNAKCTPITDQYSLVVLSSVEVTFVIAIEPELKVLHRWSRPDDIGPSDPTLPSLAFGWMNITNSGRSPTPLIVRAWGKHVQFLEVTFSGGAQHKHSKHGWPNFESHKGKETENVIVAVQWLGDQVCVYLDVHDELHVVDTMSMKQQEVVDISEVKLVYASYPTSTFQKDDGLENHEPQDSPARCFANSFRACNDILYLLGLAEFRTARVQSWTQRIDSLIEDGEWLEGLAFALDHYEGLKTAAASRANRERFTPVFFRDKRNDQCVVDIFRMIQTNQRTRAKQTVSRHGNNSSGVVWQCGEMPYAPNVIERLEKVYQEAKNGDIEAKVPMSVSERVAELLMDYVRLAIANAPSSSSSSHHNPFRPSTLKLEKAGMKKLDLSKSHYEMLAGVCIEFCATIGRKDILFGEVFRRFQEAQQSDVFVELLEPYILSGQLSIIAREVLENFVSVYAKRNQVARIEKCFLHMKVKELNLDSVLNLCHQHGLYSSLIYIYNAGLNDFTTPIDLLLNACIPDWQSTTLSHSWRSKMKKAKSKNSSIIQMSGIFGDDLDSRESRQRRLIGYKLLLYLSYVLRGLVFPSRKINTDAPAMQSNRAQVCSFVFEGDDVSNPDKHKKRRYARLAALIHMDAKTVFEMLANLYDAPDVEFKEWPVSTTAASPLAVETSIDPSKSGFSFTKCTNRLKMTLALAEVVFGPPGTDSSQSSFSYYDRSQFYMFEARVLSSGTIDAQEYAQARSGSEKSTWMMDSLMRFLAIGKIQSSSSSSDIELKDEDDEVVDQAGRESILVKLLHKLTIEHYDEPLLLKRVNREGMNRAALILYKARGNFSKVIRSYLEDGEKEFQMGAFQYIRNEYEKLAIEEDDSASTSSVSHENSVLSKVEMEKQILEHTEYLLSADAHSTVVLILELFPQLNSKIIKQFSKQGGKDGIRLEYTYCKQILGAKSRQIDSEQAELILELLDRSKVKTDDDSKMQERYVYLLCKFEPISVFPFLESHEQYSLESCLELCREHGVTDAEAYLLERTGDINGALSLILQSIETKLKILKPALRGHASHKNNSSNATGWQNQQHESVVLSVPEGRQVMQTLDIGILMCQRNSDRFNRDGQSEKLWFTLLDKFLKAQKSIKRLNSKKSSATTMRGLQTPMQNALNECIRIVLERMVAYVPLKSILSKITREHGKSEFGEFRPTIYSMFDTYHYEKNILATTNSLISSDTYLQIQSLYQAQAKALAPSSHYCAYCQGVLNKPPFGMSNASTGSTGEKWTRQNSMVIVQASGQIFHESCGKLWQQENDKKRKGKRSRRRSKAEDDEIKSSSSAATPTPTARKRVLHTRKYLKRLTKARDNHAQKPKLAQVFESLNKSDTMKNKYLNKDNTSFSLAPGTVVKYKRVGSRKPGVLPTNPVQRGSLS